VGRSLVRVQVGEPENSGVAAARRGPFSLLSLGEIQSRHRQGHQDAAGDRSAEEEQLRQGVERRATGLYQRVDLPRPLPARWTHGRRAGRVRDRPLDGDHDQSRRPVGVPRRAAAVRGGAGAGRDRRLGPRGALTVQTRPPTANAMPRRGDQIREAGRKARIQRSDPCCPQKGARDPTRSPPQGRASGQALPITACADAKLPDPRGPGREGRACRVRVRAAESHESRHWGSALCGC